MPSSPLIQISVSDLHTHSSDSELDRQGRKFLNNKQFRCSHPGCHLQFQRRDQFDRHEYTHTGIKKFSCATESCTRIYSNQSHLNRHIRSAHSVKPKDSIVTIPCQQADCTKIFGNIATAQRHYKQQHSTGPQKRQQCDLCTESFHRKDQLRRHRFKHTGEYPYHCKQCKTGFFNQRSFQRHSNSQHAVSRSYRCSLCSIDFEKWSQLVQHRREQHLPQCSKCQKEFSTITNLHLHMAVHDGDRPVYACKFDKCARFYYSLKNLYAHERSKHGTASRFECDLCNAKLSTKQKITNHLDWHLRSKEGFVIKKIEKLKRPRKDVNVPRLSTAAKLTGVRAGRLAESMILQGRGKDVEIALEAIESESSLELSQNEEQADKQKHVLNDAEQIVLPAI